MTVFHGALAYIDSGSGSVLIQMVLAGVLGASFMARSVWSTLMSKLAGKKSIANDD